MHSNSHVHESNLGNAEFLVPHGTEKPIFKAKFVRKYMKIAHLIAEDNNACYSRKIGAVLVSNLNRIISMGYNGAVEGMPHADDQDYLSHIWDNILTSEQRKKINPHKGKDQFIEKYKNCQKCPRKVLGIPSGQNLEICPCAHAERNALANANLSGVSTVNSTMYCFCSIPCHECTVQICQAKVKNVVCLKSKLPDYSPSSRFIFNKSNVSVVLVDRDWIFDGD